MKWNFPAERQKKRKVLLDAVESVREVVVAHAEEAERGFHGAMVNVESRNLHAAIIVHCA